MSRERLRDLLPFLLFFLALAGFVLHRVGWLAPVEELLIRATLPLQRGVSLAAGRLDDLARTARDLRDLRERNEDLESENARLLLENIRLREILVENTLLRDFLGFVQSNPSVEVRGAHVVGRVIGLEPGNLERYVLLDVGRESGIARSMPVITDRGLVGRIAQVGNGWSRVLLINDVGSTVNALAQTTRATGLVQGTADGALVMRSIPQADTVSVGDIVFTSGLGGNFPAQIPIGQITSVERRDYDLYQTATVEPTVDLRRLEVVMVIVGFQPLTSGAAQEGGR